MILLHFKKHCVKFFSMEDSMNVKYSMLLETYITSSSTPRLDEVGSSLLPSDVTDEDFNTYWLVCILITNHFEINL